MQCQPLTANKTLCVKFKTVCDLFQKCIFIYTRKFYELLNYFFFTPTDTTISLQLYVKYKKTIGPRSLWQCWVTYQVHTFANRAKTLILCHKKDKNYPGLMIDPESTPSSSNL